VQPELAALQPTPTAEIAVRSGRVEQDTLVLLQPGGEVVGELPAGALAIVTGSRDGHLKVIFGGGPGGYGWVAEGAVDFGAKRPASPIEATPPVEQQAAPTDSALPTALPAAAPPVPQPPALAGKLVFQTSNGGDIVTMNPDGSGLRRLTYGFDPAFSPDGSQIAFARWDEPRGLWVINADGSGERLLIGANRARSPTWSPDGRAIVFEREVGSTTCLQSPFGCRSAEEWLALFGGQPCLATPFGRFCIADFPQISSSLTGLVHYDLSSGAGRDLPASQTATAPRHKPDSAAILYLDKQGLALTQTAGDAPSQQVAPIPPLLAPATYSPNGQFIYAARQAGNRWDLWRWRSDGSQPTALTVPDPLAAQPANHVAPAASPDGRSVAFLTDRAGRWELWVMNSDGTNPRPLAPQALAGITFRYDFNADRTVDWGP
jgi:dipeptidyl aminopeptidase/acylaminoacyl peptidase